MSSRKSQYNFIQTNDSKPSNNIYQSQSSEPTTRNKKTKKLDQVETYIQIFETYLKLLIGQEIGLEEEERLNGYQNFDCSDNNNTLDLEQPEAIISLYNPDFVQDDYEFQLNQLEIFEQIIQSLSIDEQSNKEKLFLKAIEYVFLQLLDHKSYSVYDIRTRRLETQTNEQRNALYQLGSAQDLFHNSEQSPKSSYLMENNFQNKFQTQDYQKEEQNNIIQKLVTQFRQQLMGNIMANLGNINNISEYFQVDYQKLQYIQKKAYSQGEYLRQSGKFWHRTQKVTSDILTLIRNILIVQFTRRGFQVQQKISQDGEKIFLLLYMSEKMLETAAENCQLPKKISYCFTDLLSLEPVDRQYRPLRLNGRLWRPQDYQISPYLKYLRPLITEQIQQINFKKVAREVGQTGINIELFQYGKSDIHGDQDGPSDEEWTAYYKYLVHLNNHINLCRKEFQLKSDIALIIDKQKTVEQLVAIRTHSKHKNFDEFNEEEQKHYRDLNEEVQQLIIQSNSLVISSKLPQIKKIKLYLQQQLAHNYLTIFNESLKVANCTNHQLKTVWERYNITPFDLYVPFQINKKDSSTKNIERYQLRWCRYIKNEKNHITLFPSNERLKLAYSVLQSCVSLDTLVKLKLVNKIFCLHDFYELYGWCKNIQNAVSEQNKFYKKRTFDLVSDWEFNYKEPWVLPKERICSYFGEKIGLFLEFTTHHILCYSVLSILGFLFTIAMITSKELDKQTYTAIISIFSLLVVLWNSFVTDYWKTTQIKFNIRQGFNKRAQEKLILMSFKGQYIRSVENDELNSLGSSQAQIISKLIISIFILILLIGSDFGVIIAKFNEFNNKFYNLEIIISSSLNFGIQKLIEQYYEQIATFLTDFENLQISNQYETSYTIKKYTLYSLSGLFPLLVIQFLNSPFYLYCWEESCKNEIQYFFATTIFWIFTLQFIKYFRLYFKVKEQFHINQQIQNTDSLLQLIQDQNSKVPFWRSSEKDGIVDEYMEFFLFSTLINLFGCVFPLSVTFFWIWMILQVQILKLRLCYQLQRPWPKNEGSLGVWDDLNQLINLVAILSNSGITSIYYKSRLLDDIILLFLSLLFYHFLIKCITLGIFGNTPRIMQQIIQRGKYIYKSNIQILMNKSRKEKQDKEQLQRSPIFKIFAAKEINFTHNFETISSDEDISYFYSKNIGSISKRLVAEEEQLQLKLIEFPQNNDSQKQLFTSNTGLKIFQETIDCQSGSALFQKKEEQKSDALLMKRQQTKLNEWGKKIKNVKTLDYQFLRDYFSKRICTWAFQVSSIRQDEKKLIQDRTKIWRFLFRLNLLSNYTMLWSDFRIHLSQSFIQRKLKILHNLDYKRYKILKQSYETQFEFYTDKAYIKFKQQLKQFGTELTQDEKNEQAAILQKKANFITKKSWLNCRKVQIFRYRCLFFKGFRKQTIRQSSLQIAILQYEAKKKLSSVQFESDIHKKFGALVQYSSINQYTLDMFIDLFDQLEYEQKSSYIFQSTNGRLNNKIYHLQSLKSDIYKNIIDKSKDTYIFEQYNTKLEEYSLQYFIDEINQIPNIKIQKHIHDILWQVQIDEKEYLMQFFQVRHSQTLQFQKFYNGGHGIFLGQSKNYIRLLNIVDQIDDFLIKGYCVSLYSCSNSKSLYQVISFRRKNSLYYTVEELMQFLYSNLILLQKHKIANISIYNYILVQNEYMVLNSVNQETNPIQQLVQMIAEMILLKPIEDLQNAINTMENPLQYLLSEILLQQKSPTQIIEMISVQQRFVELDYYSLIEKVINFDPQSLLDQKYKTQTKKEVTYQQYMELMKHQINFHFRIKQFKTALNLIQEVENYMKINLFQNDSNLLLSFINYFSKNLHSYLLKSNEIKKILDILLIYYFKISTLFALRQEIDLENCKLIEALKRCIIQLRIIFRQLNLNIKLENLSDIEQSIILKRKIKQNNNQASSISSFDRLNLINTLRKNKDYIQIIIQYQTQIQRYLNQFQVLRAIQTYFHQNYKLADIQFQEIIQNQQTIVFPEPRPLLLDIPLDCSTALINFEQTSPLDDEILENYGQESLNQLLTDENQLYYSQLLYYKFLQLIIHFDSKNEQEQNHYKEFIALEGANEDLFNFYKNQLILLSKDKQSLFTTYTTENCEVGKYLKITEMKWNEINRKKLINLIESEDDDFMKLQIIAISNLNPTLENRRILLAQCDQVYINSFQRLCQIKSIQQILHLDDFQPTPHNIKCQLSKQNIHLMKQFSFIKLLQDFHSQFQPQNDSWFFHQNLNELQIFYYLSICFAYSPKLIENLNQQKTKQLENAINQINQLSTNPKFYCQSLKCIQINNQQIQELQIDISLSQYQQYQLFCQFLNCSIISHSNLKQSYMQIREYLNRDFECSIIVLALLHSYMYFQQFDMFDLIYQFSQRLLNSQAFIFHKIHSGFDQDLQILENVYKNKSNCLPLPSKYLYEYTPNFLYFEDIKFNCQYLLFNLMINQDYHLISEILVETLSILQNQTQLIRLMHLFESLLDVVNAMMGNIEPKKQYITRLGEYKETTLMYALLSQLKCRFHLNLIDYENALKYSNKTLSYIDACLKQQRTIISIANNEIVQEYPINTTLQNFQFQVYDQLINESHDVDYIHLFNKDFINEAILNHIRILINIEKDLPKFNLLFELQLELQNKIHINYLQMIYATYFSLLLNQHNQIQIKQCVIDHSKYIEILKLKIVNEEMRQSAYYALKFNMISEITEIDQKLKILDFQLNILLGTKNGINQKLMNTWIMQCCQKGIDGYIKLSSKDQKLVHPYVSLMYLIQCQAFQFLNQIHQAQRLIEDTEACLKEWFDLRQHPLKGLFFYYQGAHNRWLYNQYLICVQEIISLQQFDRVEIKFLVQGLINQEKQLIKTFDYFHSNLIKSIKTHLANFIYQSVGKRNQRQIVQGGTKLESTKILNDVISASTLGSLDGVTQFLDALAIFNYFETENKCIDLIRFALISQDK
ncbi:unnamed protein product (macronuclear) [Paramecium tetraurelia]|uniref:Anoctamin transmembrane domain-containing protein n=1 Tax=Paramecium tetraurelia TaxID=5888 RepID=A0DHW5_PARTE|nr:uncharacterized protein GSPATT00017003001 [Paramecium tetraurelia]CAK82632.1 unnamed protein product [Paramecium tetraurelia]|eukprot:XP_001450029.1 hypothetical protein (macronuclear) [Paramecium tetraurelia strain d4-2]